MDQHSDRNNSDDQFVAMLQNPLMLRVSQCPKCQKKHLFNVENLAQEFTCACKTTFHIAQNIVDSEITATDAIFTKWECERCGKKLVVPRFAVVIPGQCQCHNDYPTARRAGPSRYFLDEPDEAFVGIEPHFEESMLTPLRAAQRYDYEVSQNADGTYSLRNPKKGSTYTVKLSTEFVDECDCSVFQAGGGTCIHVEHARIKMGLPSTAQEIANSKEFAYAWMDKSSLPPRVRIGWVGDIESKVRSLVRKRGAITSLLDLDEIEAAFKKERIDFHSLLSAKFALTTDITLESDPVLARRVSQDGRALLAKKIPQLHQFQIEGALFLASAQRALLLDEMGLGKTVQALSAALLLREFANVSSCLILAPKSVLRHWKSEASKFTGLNCTIVEGSAGLRAEQYESETFFKATTIESFRRDFPNVGQHDLIIVDEIHKARSVKSVTNRVLRQAKSKFLFGLSGTAIEKSLEDLYTILRIIRSPRLEPPLHFYASHIVADEFGTTRYELHPEFFYVRHADRILRRCKSETEANIPSIEIEQVNLPLSRLQDEMAEPLRKELDVLSDRLKERYEVNDFNRHRWLVNRIVELSNSSELLDPQTKASSKIEWLKQFLNAQCVELKEKVVVFTRWVRSQEIILRECKNLGLQIVSLNGQNTAAERETAVDQFTNNQNVQVFVSTDAGGVGVNLQVARILVNFEPAWNPSTDAQRIQRLHRIGQRRNVHAFLPETTLDQEFTLSTHPRKQFAAGRIDAVRQTTTGESIQSWEELVAVIDLLRHRLETNQRPLIDELPEFDSM